MPNDREDGSLTPEERRLMSEQNRSLAQEQNRQRNSDNHEDVWREPTDDAYYYNGTERGGAYDAEEDDDWCDQAFEVVQPRRNAQANREMHGDADAYADDTDYYAGYADGTSSEKPPFRMPLTAGFAPVSGTSALAEEPDEEPDEDAEFEEDIYYAPEPQVLAEPARFYEEGTKGASASGGASRGSKVSRGGRFNEKTRRMSNPNRITTGSAIVIGLLAILLLGLVIYGKVQTNEMYMKIASLQSEYDNLVSRNDSMRSEMEARLTVKNIEEYAEKELGLKQLDQSQIEYIAIQTEDEVYITKQQEGWMGVVNEYLRAIWDFVRGR